mmetsp:Transcript_30887/g.59552  ORF Transcript_30887/g.59552 Transcript_30887/m.59552 type:complete len:320 (-) Transcript_30887:120-1079(-)
MFHRVRCICDLPRRKKTASVCSRDCRWIQPAGGFSSEEQPVFHRPCELVIVATTRANFHVRVRSPRKRVTLPPSLQGSNRIRYLLSVDSPQLLHGFLHQVFLGSAFQLMSCLAREYRHQDGFTRHLFEVPIHVIVASVFGRIFNVPKHVHVAPEHVLLFPFQYELVDQAKSKSTNRCCLPHWQRWVEGHHLAFQNAERNSNQNHVSVELECLLFPICCCCRPHDCNSFLAVVHLVHDVVESNVEAFSELRDNRAVSFFEEQVVTSESVWVILVPVFQGKVTQVGGTSIFEVGDVPVDDMLGQFVKRRVFQLFLVFDCCH